MPHYYILLSSEFSGIHLHCFEKKKKKNSRWVEMQWWFWSTKSHHLIIRLYSLDLIRQRNPASLWLLSKTEQVCICALTISAWEICMRRWCGCQLVHESGSCCSSWISQPRPHIVAFRGVKRRDLHNSNHQGFFFSHAVGSHTSRLHSSFFSWWMWCMFVWHIAAMFAC